MSDKAQRQAALNRLIRERPIASQDEMVVLLRNLGFSATQSSISRDVRELGLVRLGGRYVHAGRAVGGDGSVVTEPEYELITSVEPIGANLIVVRTQIGAANAVAAALDRQALPEIAGSIAGDDTIFLAVRSRAAQGRVLAQLRPVRRAAGRRTS